MIKAIGSAMSVMLGDVGSAVLLYSGAGVMTGTHDPLWEGNRAHRRARAHAHPYTGAERYERRLRAKAKRLSCSARAAKRRARGAK